MSDYKGRCCDRQHGPGYGFTLQYDALQDLYLNTAISQ